MTSGQISSGQISSGLDLTYDPSTITSQKPTEHELDLLFEAMYDDYIGGQPSAAPRTTPATPVSQQQDDPAQLQPEEIADNVPNLHPRIHQKHWTDPGDGGSVGRTSYTPGTDLNFKSTSEQLIPLFSKEHSRRRQASSVNSLVVSSRLCLNRSIDLDKYLEGQSMQRPPLFESDYFIYWRNRFETYVNAKDLDLWHIILNGDFPPLAKNEVTQILEVVPFEEQSIDLKKKLAKNNEAKMVLYNALPKNEYERIFMCKTAKDIWQSLLNTHQESIDSGFARFNTIITSLKALDEELKDLSSLALDELIRNLKVHEVVMEKDSKIYKGKKERIKSIVLKAKKESSDDETSTSGSDEEEYAMAIRNFKKFLPESVIGSTIQEKKGSHSDKEMRRKEKKLTRNVFRCREMTPKTKPTMNLFSWLNRPNEKLERSKEIEMGVKSCDELKLENAKLKETQVKFVKFDKSANSLREMLNNQKSPSCKIGLGFDRDKASTNGTKTMSFVRSSAEKVTDESTIKGHGSTLPGSVSRKDSKKGTEHVFSPPVSSRSDFVITRKKLIHNSIDESKKPSLKPSLKSSIGYVKIEV
ncbi:hypothetical protein Tco_1507158 [Tanacetum coccineum]